jgi:hypothetical protein
MGPDGSTSFSVFNPAIAFGSALDEYLVVWRTEHDQPPLVDNEPEIFGQRLNAVGAGVGVAQFRISDMGPNGNTAFGGFRPSVAYSTNSHTYLVVWYGDDDTGPLVDEEFEIYGQEPNALGDAVGANDFRISQMGPDGDADFDSAAPDLAYNSRANEYLITWQGEDNASPLRDDDFQIFGRRARAGGGKLDRRRPKLRLRARKVQPFVRRREVVVGATSDERASLLGTARLALGGASSSRTLLLKPIRRGIDAGRRELLLFKFSPRALSAVKRARGRAAARVTIRITDTAGNSGTKQVGIRGKR